MLFFPQVYLCICAGSGCPESFQPYLNSFTCVKIVLQPAVNYTVAVRLASSQADRMLAPSTNASVLRFYANVSGVPGALWVRDSSQVNSSCPALDSDGVVRTRQCSENLPFAVLVDIRGEEKC